MHKIIQTHQKPKNDWENTMYTENQCMQSYTQKIEEIQVAASNIGGFSSITKRSRPTPLSIHGD